MADAKVNFPGIDRVAAASMTFSHGITPSVCQITTAPQRNFPARGGTLAFSFRGISFSFPDCCIDTMSYSRGPDGMTWTLAILDRRWKWQFGYISGMYNRQQADGRVDVTTERRPRDLAELLLMTMKETDYDISALPDDQRPEIIWDYDNPAACLANLVEPLGCRVTLGLNNKVKIVKVGEGARVPDGAIMDDAGTMDPPEKPSKIMLIGAPAKWQAQLKLEAVGIDRDGSIKKIDDLSYKPARGWGQAIPLDADDWRNITSLTDRVLASETVFRWYRVIGHRDGTLKIPGLEDNMFHIKQIFPLDDRLVEQVADPLDENRMKDKRARVLGNFMIWGVGKAEEAKRILYDGLGNDDDRPYPYGFSIDRERGIVQFSRPCALYSTSPGWVPADVYLETSFGFRYFTSRGTYRYQKVKDIPTPTTTAEKIHRDETFQSTHRATYDPKGALTGKVTNKEEIDPKAEALLTELEKEFETTEPADRTYAGLVRIDLDGAIQQVTWSVSLSGAVTRASRNNEHRFDIPSYAERRLLEKSRTSGSRTSKIESLAAEVGLKW